MTTLANNEQRLMGFIQAGQWREAKALLKPFLAGEPDEKGWAKLHLAGVLYWESGRYASDAATCLDEALAVLPNTSQEFIRGCIHGLTLSLYMDDMDRANRIRALGKSAIGTGAEAVVPWRGRWRYAKAVVFSRLAELALLDERPKEAAEWYAKAERCGKHALEFYELNPGPFANDRHCMVPYALTLVADVLWATGRRTESAALVESYMSQLAQGPMADTLPVYPYWCGRVALSNNNHHDAAKHFLEALPRSEKAHSHYLTGRIVEGVAQAYLEADDYEALEQFKPVVRRMIQDAADARNYGLVDRLQQSLEQSRVGRNLYAEQSGVDKG